MRRLTTALLLAGLCVAPVSAQGLRITQPAPDCRVWQSAFDNPFSDTKGYTQPRMVWHAEYALASYGLAALIQRVTHVRPWIAATITTVAIGVLPHVRSVLIQRRYPINPGDLAFDAVNRATPFIAVARHTDDSTKTFFANHWKATAVWLAADLTLACFSSP